MRIDGGAPGDRVGVRVKDYCLVRPGTAWFVHRGIHYVRDGLVKKCTQRSENHLTSVYLQQNPSPMQPSSHCRCKQRAKRLAIASRFYNLDG